MKARFFSSPTADEAISKSTLQNCSPISPIAHRKEVILRYAERGALSKAAADDDEASRCHDGLRQTGGISIVPREKTLHIVASLIRSFSRIGGFGARVFTPAQNAEQLHVASRTTCKLFSPAFRKAFYMAFTCAFVRPRRAASRRGDQATGFATFPCSTPQKSPLVFTVSIFPRPSEASPSRRFSRHHQHSGDASRTSREIGILKRSAQPTAMCAAFLAEAGAMGLSAVSSVSRSVADGSALTGAQLISSPAEFARRENFLHSLWLAFAPSPSPSSSASSRALPRARAARLNPVRRPPLRVIPANHCRSWVTSDCAFTSSGFLWSKCRLRGSGLPITGR